MPPAHKLERRQRCGFVAGLVPRAGVLAFLLRLHGFAPRAQHAAAAPHASGIAQCGTAERTDSRDSLGPIALRRSGGPSAAPHDPSQRERELRGRLLTLLRSRPKPDSDHRGRSVPRSPRRPHTHRRPTRPPGGRPERQPPLHRVRAERDSARSYRRGSAPRCGSASSLPRDVGGRTGSTSSRRSRRTPPRLGACGGRAQESHPLIGRGAQVPEAMYEDVPSLVELGWRSELNSMRRLRQFRGSRALCLGERGGAGRRRAGASAYSP